MTKDRTPLDGLTPLMRRYADEWLLRVGTNPTYAEIARAAGCKSTSPKGLRTRAHQLHRRTEAARAYLVEKYIRNPDQGALAIGVIKHLAQFGRPDTVRLAAAAKLAELSGYQPIKVSEVHHHAHVHESQEELRERARRLFSLLSAEERAFLTEQGRLPPPAIEAEFVSVPTKGSDSDV